MALRAARPCNTPVCPRCLSPYLPIYLRDVKNLAPGSLGLVMAAGQIGVLIMPVFMTLLADRYRVVSPLLIALFALNTLAVGLLSQAAGFWACLACVFLFQLANQPQIALSDGLFFSLQADPRMPRRPYSSVRVWGTIGFIVASTLVWLLYDLGDGVKVVPFVAMGVAFASLVNAVALPRRLGPVANAGGVARRLPTLDAAAVLLRPRILLLCLGLGLLVATNAAYYSFYPLYLSEVAGIGSQWSGVIATIGVTFEIGYMLAFERLRDRFGLPGLMLLGGGACVARLAVLAFLPTAGFTIGLQVMHGLTVIGIIIVPAMYLNSLVPDHCRNSVQGLYVMLVGGGFSIIGNTVSGHVAELGLLTLYRNAFVTCAMGLGLIALSFLWPRRPSSEPTA